MNPFHRRELTDEDIESGNFGQPDEPPLKTWQRIAILLAWLSPIIYIIYKGVD